MKKLTMPLLLRFILITIAVLPTVAINAQESYSAVLKFNPDSIESIQREARNNNPYAIVWLDYHDKLDTVGISKAAVNAAYDSIARIEPGDDPCLNYYKGVALMQKNYDYIKEHGDGNGNGGKAYELYPYFPCLETAARAGYPGAVDALYGVGVWGGVGGIESKPRDTYDFLEKLEAAGNRDALLILVEYNAFRSPDDAVPYAIKLASITKEPKDANHAVECLSSAAYGEKMPLMTALAKADEVAAACSQPSGVYYKIYTDFKDRLSAVKRQAYFKKALDGGSPLACLEKGDFYYKGKIEDLNLDKALEYYEKAINAADDVFKDNHGYEYSTLLWNAYRIRKSYVYGYDVNSSLNYLRTLAGKSDSKAMIELGDRILDTRYAAENWNDPAKLKKVCNQAVEWYKKAESGAPAYARFKLLNSGQLDKASTAAYIKKLKDQNTFESVYYLALYYYNNGQSGLALNWLNHYFGSYNENVGKIGTLSDAIVLYDDVADPDRRMYSMDIAAGINHNDDPNDVTGEWVYGLSLIDSGKYADGLKSLERSISLAMEQGRITEEDVYSRLYTLALFMQGQTLISWEGKQLKLPAKYRKIARGRKLQKIAEANFEYDDV